MAEEEKDKNKDTVSKDLVKWDMNFSEYPFFIPIRGTNRPKEIEIKFGEGRVFRIESSTGVPGAFDADVLFAIAYLAQQSDLFKEKSRVYFSMREIADILGVTYGRNRSRIRESLERWFKTGIYLEGIYRKEGKVITNEIWVHPIRKVQIYKEELEKKFGIPRSKAGDYTYIEFDSDIVRSVLAGYAKIIDLRYFRQLRNPFSKRLYLYLGKKIGNQSKFTISFKKLCEVIPILTYINSRALDRAFNVFKKAMEELSDTYDYVYRESSKSDGRKGKDYIVTFFRKKAIEPSIEWIAVREFLTSKLKALGFGPTEIHKLLNDDWETLARIWFYVNEQVKSGEIRNAKQYFKKILKEHKKSNSREFHIDEDLLKKFFRRLKRVWDETQTERFKKDFSGIYEEKKYKPVLFGLFFLDWAKKYGEKKREVVVEEPKSREELKEEFKGIVKNLMEMGYTMESAIEKVSTWYDGFKELKQRVIDELHIGTQNR